MTETMEELAKANLLHKVAKWFDEGIPDLEAVIKLLVEDELNGLAVSDRVIRAGELIEFVNRVLVVSLADTRALAVSELRASRPGQDAAIAAETRISPQTLRKLEERASLARRRPENAAA